MIEKKTFLYSVALNLIFLALCLFWGNLRFGAIDDYFMSGILSGIYGEDYNVHLTFVNAMYGYCLLPFYYLFPKVNWYYIGEMASVFVSLSVICYILIRKIGYRWGVVVATLFVALCASDYYLVVQFTQCAAMLSAAGMLAFIYGLEKNGDNPQSKKWIILLIVGVLLLWWGSWMRWPAFLMGLPFFTCALLLQIIKIRKIKWFACSALLVLFVGVWGGHEFDRSLYGSFDYKKYIDFQGPRSLLGDGLNYNRQAVDEDLDEMERSGKDYVMLTDWIFYDSYVFAPESIKVVTDVIGRYFYQNGIQSALVIVLKALQKSVQRPVFMAWLLLCFALFYFNPQKKLWPWISLLTVMVLIAYLLNLQRFVYRVETGLWLYAAVLTIPFLKEKMNVSKKFSVGAVFIIVLVNVFLYATEGTYARSPNTGDLVMVQNEDADTADYKGLMRYIDSVPDSTVFIMKMNSYMRLSRKKNPPYLAEPKGSWNQIYSFGFWTPYFPEVEKELHKRGVTNPIKDVVRDNVFVIDEPLLVDFLERHYYDKVLVDTVRNFDGIIVYKYSLVNDSLLGAE